MASSYVRPKKHEISYYFTAGGRRGNVHIVHRDAFLIFKLYIVPGPIRAVLLIFKALRRSIALQLIDERVFKHVGHRWERRSFVDVGSKNLREFLHGALIQRIYTSQASPHRLPYWWAVETLLGVLGPRLGQYARSVLARADDECHTPKRDPAFRMLLSVTSVVYRVDRGLSLVRLQHNRGLTCRCRMVPHECPRSCIIHSNNDMQWKRTPEFLHSFGYPTELRHEGGVPSPMALLCSGIALKDRSYVEDKGLVHVHPPMYSSRVKDTD